MRGELLALLTTEPEQFQIIQTMELLEGHVLAELRENWGQIQLQIFHMGITMGLSLEFLEPEIKQPAELLD